MVSKKTYIMLFSILAIFTGVVLFFGATYEQGYFSIIIDPVHKLTYRNNKWNFDNENLGVADRGYEIYDETGYIGKYTVTNIASKKRWFIYDKNMSEVSKTGEIFGFKSNLDYEYVSLEVSSLTASDEQYITNALEENNLNIDQANSFSTKYIVDLDGDNNKDTVLVSNLSYDSSYESSSYAIIVAIVKNKEYTLYVKGRENDSGYETPFVNVVAIFDIKKDGYKEMIIKETFFGESNSCASVIEFDKNGFKKHLKC